MIRDLVHGLLAVLVFFGGLSVVYAALESL
jgi:hypothetical protein